MSNKYTPQPVMGRALDEPARERRAFYNAFARQCRGYDNREHTRAVAEEIAARYGNGGE
jgi:hypothetical protein